MDIAAPGAAGAVCSNCDGGPVDHYCARCGQRRMTERDFTVAGFFHESVMELTSLDGRLLATLVALVRRPGQLARDYFAGRGSRFMKPLSLFVLMNLVFFIIQPHTGLLKYDLANYIDYDGDVTARRRDDVNAVRLDRAFAEAAERTQRDHKPHVPVVEPLGVFRVRFDDALQDLKKSMLIVSIPLLALVMAVLYVGSGRRFAEHLVLSVHIYAFFLLFSGVFVTPAFIATYWIFKAFGASRTFLGALGTESTLAIAMLLAMGTYIFLALRRMHGGWVPVVAARALVLSLAMQVLIVGYHDVLFFATLASL